MLWYQAESTCGHIASCVVGVHGHSFFPCSKPHTVRVKPYTIRVHASCCCTCLQLQDAAWLVAQHKLHTVSNLTPVDGVGLLEAQYITL